MTFYTVLPLEDVLEGIEDEPIPTLEISMGGMTLEVEALGDFQARVVRLVSTDPKHYLASHLAPGSIIDWSKV